MQKLVSTLVGLLLLVSTSIIATPRSTWTYATNTSFDVIRVSTTPKGPWKLTDSVPAEIYTIPPSNPLYDDTYVQVYSSSADDVVFGFTAGYMMGFVTARASAAPRRNTLTPTGTGVGVS